MKNPGRGIRHGSSKNSVTANEELMLQMEKQKRYQYVCIECGMMYTSSGHLKTHMYKHTGEKPFPCTFPGCSAAFYESGNLKTHMRTHTKEKPFGCMYCGTRFARSTDLRIHVRSHTGERPYACKHPDCTAAFTECGKLKRHMLIHSGERPHACLLCNAGFTDAGHLRRHVMRHTGEKPHACSYCNKTFAQAGELRRHTRSRHCETPKRRGRPPKPKPTQDGTEAEPAPQQACEVSQASSEPEIETEGESMSLKRFDDGRAETFQTGDSNSSSSTYSVGKMDAVKKAFYGHTARLPSESPEVEQRTAVKLEIDADASVQPVGDSTTLPGAEVTSASVASQQADCVVKLEPSSDSEETDNMDVYFQPNLGKSQKAKPVNQKAQVKVQNNQALHPEELQNCANAAFEAGWSNQFAEQGDCVDAAELDLLHKQFVERFVNKRPPGRRILSCGECSAKFATPSKLKRHVMIHQGERPFKCPHCIHAFTQAGNLKVHLRKHNGERPFVCEVCANAFTRSAELKRHLRIYHSS